MMGKTFHYIFSMIYFWFVRYMMMFISICDGCVSVATIYLDLMIFTGGSASV